MPTTIPPTFSRSTSRNLDVRPCTQGAIFKQKPQYLPAQDWHSFWHWASPRNALRCDRLYLHPTPQRCVKDCHTTAPQSNLDSDQIEYHTKHPTIFVHQPLSTLPCRLRRPTEPLLAVPVSQQPSRARTPAHEPRRRWAPRPAILPPPLPPRRRPRRPTRMDMPRTHRRH